MRARKVARDGSTLAREGGGRSVNPSTHTHTKKKKRGGRGRHTDLAVAADEDRLLERRGEENDGDLAHGGRGRRGVTVAPGGVGPAARRCQLVSQVLCV